MHLKLRIFSIIASLAAGNAAADTQPAGSVKDWAQHDRYASANLSLQQTPDVVFIGNSITDGWFTFRPDFFNSRNFAGRGISGQVTSQMLCRFKADVIDLHPRAVVICGGVNDLVGNNGDIEIPHIVDNIESMVDLARANGIIPLVGSALPSNYAFWKPNFKGLDGLIRAYNEKLEQMCRAKNVRMIDYYSPLVAPDGGIIPVYSDDRLHPNAFAYETVMEPLVLKAIADALDATATQPEIIPLWPDGAPTDNGFRSGDEGVDGVMETNIANPVLYIYPAANPNGVAILCCPGGAYYGVAMEHEGHQMARWMNDLGVTFAVLRYRMPNGGHCDVPLSDAEKAMEILRGNASGLSVDPHSIGVMGFSAGGHLASTLATQCSGEATRPDFQVLVYPVISMDSEITHAGSRENLLGKSPSPELVRKYSSELQVNSKTPKAFLAVSADDDLVPIANTLRYVQALSDAGVPASLHIYPVGGHGWGFHDSFPYKSDWTSEFESWLKNEIL